MAAKQCAVSDHKHIGGALLPMASISVQKLLSSPPAKFGPIEVVDYLPSSSAAKDVFALTVLRINDSQSNEKYNAMHEKMNSYAQLVAFDSELQIGYDGVYRELPSSIKRVRRISATKLYLVDFGKVINYEKSKCFQIPKVFQTIPTRVSICVSFDNIREVVQKWGAMENATLHAVTCGFAGPINIINIFCGNSVIATRWSAARVDYFSETPVSTYEKFLRQQVEDIIGCCTSETVRKKNIDVMNEAEEAAFEVKEKAIKKRKKASGTTKRFTEKMAARAAEAEVYEETSEAGHR